ncbi:MAG: integrase, partial [Mycobacterium sp.]|nr:integrase [Mycobacterium sp.]
MKGMTGRRQFGSLRRLPSGRWQARFCGPGGKTVTAPHTFARKIDGECWLGDRRKEIDNALWNPQAAPPDQTTFSDYSQRWLRERRTSGRPLRPRTRVQYEKMLTVHLLPQFGDHTLTSITAQQIRTWYSTLLDDAPSMRSQVYQLLHAVLASAVSDEVIDANPARIRAAGQSKRVHKVIPASVKELSALTEHMPDQLKLTVPLASWCALRYGEMTELRRGDIDLDAEVIRVRRAVVFVKGGFIVGEPKSQAGIRNVAIPPHLLPTISDHLERFVGQERDALLF